MKLFISYARKDQGRVRRLVDLLQAAGHEVWFDEALLLGQAWQEELAVEFRDGQIYRYLDVPAKVYREFMRAHALGAYFHKNIKDVYRYHLDDRL